MLNPLKHNCREHCQEMSHQYLERRFQLTKSVTNFIRRLKLRTKKRFILLQTSDFRNVLVERHVLL
jgi:hypothetical protein